MLDFSLSEKQLAIRKQARAFAVKEVLPLAWAYDELDQTPLSVLEKAFAQGFVSGDIPKKYGGLGQGLLDGIVAIEEIAAAGPGIATSVFDNSLGLTPLYLCENEELRQRLLPKIAKEFILVCFGTSEPTMGSDVSGIRCEAKQDGENWVLNGTKYWITNGGIADYMTVFATADKAAQHQGICGFFVDMSWPGISRGNTIPKMGQRCSNTVGVHFDNVFVPKEFVLAEPGKGFVLAMKTFSRTRPAIAAFAVGAARSAMEYAIDFAKKRRAFGSKIASFQAIGFKIADMFQKVETSRLLTYKSAWEVDAGMDATVSASIAKMYATEAALEVVNEALQVFGGYGYTKMFPVEKLLRDIRLFRIYEGTSEVQRMIVGGHALSGYEPSMPALEQVFVHRKKDVTKEKIPAWRCRMCGHVHYEEDPPEKCPYCFFPASAFVRENG